MEDCGLETKRNLEQLAKMSPEQREAIERIRARQTTPERPAEVAAAQEQIRREFPPKDQRM